MEIIEQLKQHLQASAPQSPFNNAAFKPATTHEVEYAENLLNFTLPEIVRELYLRVSNGGFGPGEGVFSIEFAANEYVDFRSDREHNQPEWPLQLVPICDWGCNIYTCLDCSYSNVPVIRVDYNLDMPWMIQTYMLHPDFQFFQPYSNDAVVAWVEAISLEKWLSSWLVGVDIFHAAYPQRKPKLEW